MTHSWYQPPGVVQPLPAVDPEPAAPSTSPPRLTDDLDMRRLDRRIATMAEAHPLPYAVAVALAAGVPGLLLPAAG